MANRKLPTNTIDLLLELELRYPDVADVEDTLSPFERGKQAGVIQLLRELKQRQNKGV